jgi:mRNA-degrading endonuclease toxin of MazEF toxin-antitoxin module
VAGWGAKRRGGTRPTSSIVGRAQRRARPATSLSPRAAASPRKVFSAPQTSRGRPLSLSNGGESSEGG